MVIYLESQLPGISSDLPETERATPQSLLLSLAPDGVYQADKSPCRWCALTAPFHPYLCQSIGGLFSVALSLRSPSLAVSKHPALWSPDFPQPCGRDHFTYSCQYQFVIISYSSLLCYTKYKIALFFSSNNDTD